MKSSCLIPLLAALMLSVQSISFAVPPTPAEPDFGPNVLVFDPAMPDIQEKVNAVFAKQERSQFGPERFALLFKPGAYTNLDVQVGFYTHVMGLGASPDDVAVTGAVRAHAKWMGGNATCNFWRTIENLSVTPTRDGGAMVWGVSQATALRRMHVKGNLNLADTGWSSGGFVVDSVIDGTVDSGSQQQYFTRNDDWKKWSGGVWNMVFVGVTNPPPGDWPQRPYTVIPSTPNMREKPYLVFEGGQYSVVVPPLTLGSSGPSWTKPGAASKRIPIGKFYIAHPGKDTAATINAALTAGKHLILTPGLYNIDATIKVTRADTVVLGIGYPTLTATKGTSIMAVSDVDGVSIAGILFEAGPVESPTLLQVGEPGKSANHARNPIVLSDVFCRAGGAIPGMTSCFVTIDANNVIGDNFWLWRADHGAGAKWDINKNRNGIIVNGKDVTCYGLFVEHCQEYQTIWNGEGGRVFFYQSEMPYDPPNQDAWKHDGINGYASYKVADTVKTHEAYGVGAYCAFRAPVSVESAIEAPTAPGIIMRHLVAVRLGRNVGGIKYVLNNTVPCSGTDTKTPDAGPIAPIVLAPMPDPPAAPVAKAAKPRHRIGIFGFSW